MKTQAITLSVVAILPTAYNVKKSKTEKTVFAEYEFNTSAKTLIWDGMFKNSLS